MKIIVALSMMPAPATAFAQTKVTLMYTATAPFVTAADLQQGLTTLERSHGDFALSVTRYSSPIQRAVRIDAQGRLAMFNPEHFQTRSQDLEPAFHDAAQFYWGRVAAWQSADTLFGLASVAVVLPAHRVQDIDTPEDWSRAEWMFKAQHRLP